MSPGPSGPARSTNGRRSVRAPCRQLTSSPNVSLEKPAESRYMRSTTTDEAPSMRSSNHVSSRRASSSNIAVPQLMNSTAMSSDRYRTRVLETTGRPGGRGKTEYVAGELRAMILSGQVAEGDLVGNERD